MHEHILITSYNFTEENIIVLHLFSFKTPPLGGQLCVKKGGPLCALWVRKGVIEPSREVVMTTLNTIIGSSSLVTQIIIYYAGYGNGIKPDLSKEPGIIDNLAKVMVPADFTQIDVSQLLAQSCCKTLCIMDMCPYKDEDMPMKWSADIHNHIKIVTFCESDSHNSNKNKLLQQMICELTIS